MSNYQLLTPEAHQILDALRQHGARIGAPKTTAAAIRKAAKQGDIDIARLCDDFDDVLFHGLGVEAAQDQSDMAGMVSQAYDSPPVVHKYLFADEELMGKLWRKHVAITACKVVDQHGGVWYLYDAARIISQFPKAHGQTSHIHNPTDNYF